MTKGFLKTAAPFSSDLTLVIEMGMGLALLLGMALARRGRYRAHAVCQSAVVLMNLAPIVLNMAPSFRRSFAPPIPDLHNSYYFLAAAHGAAGVFAELFALYVLIVAGTPLLPKRLRFTRYRPWMRTALGLWWMALLLGLATYARWYVMPLWSQ